MSIVPGKRDSGSKPEMAFRQRIVMPVEGFLASYKIIQEIMEKMEQSGLIARQPTQYSNGQIIDATPQTSAPHTNEVGSGQV